MSGLFFLVSCVFYLYYSSRYESLVKRPNRVFMQLGHSFACIHEGHYPGVQTCKIANWLVLDVLCLTRVRLGCLAGQCGLANTDSG